MTEQSNQPSTSETGPSPSAHPNVINPLFEKNDHHLAGKLASAARDALKSAYDVHALIDSVEQELRASARPDAPVYRHGSEIRKEHGAEDELAKAASKATERALQTTERRTAELMGYRDALAKSVEHAISFPNSGNPYYSAISQEIRAHVKSLSETARTQFMHDAINRNDVQTLDAVLSNPFYLSGVSQEESKRLRAYAAEKLAPAESALLRSTDRALSYIRASASSLMQRNADISSVATERAERRAAALAKLAAK